MVLSVVLSKQIFGAVAMNTGKCDDAGAWSWRCLLGFGWRTGNVQFILSFNLISFQKIALIFL